MDPLISEISQLFVLILYVPLAGGVALCGLTTNTINIIVFARQSLQESASVCLLLLSICDLGVCLTTVLYALTYSLDRFTPPGNICIYDLSLLMSALPRMFFGELSMCTTVVMSMERCLCVVRPLTFKSIINRRNTIVLLGLLYAEVAVTNVAQYWNYSMDWQWDSIINDTQWKLVHTNGPQSMSVTVHHLLNNVVLTTSAMAIVVVCTCVMVAGLKASRNFRQNVKSTTNQRELTTTHKKLNSPVMSVKEARLVKTITMLSIIFLTCNAPVMATLVAKKLVPDLNMYGEYATLNDILWAVLYLSASINATVTICVYLKTSTKYGIQFAHLFKKDKPVKSAFIE